MKKRPKPPSGLGPEARNLWTRTLAAWPVAQEATLLCCLRSACYALERLRRAEKILKTDGNGGLYVDRFGQPRQHPICLVIRDNGKMLHDALKMLSLDLEFLNSSKRDESDPELEIEET